jgi:uncharacterized membrane protein YhhN
VLFVAHLPIRHDGRKLICRKLGNLVTIAIVVIVSINVVVDHGGIIILGVVVVVVVLVVMVTEIDLVEINGISRATGGDEG